MKILLFFIFTAISAIALRSEEFTSGGIFVSAATPDVVYMEAAKNSTITNKLENGITYRLLDYRFEIILNKQQSVDLDVSSGISIRVSPETTFFIDLVDQLVKNYESTPSVLDVDYSISSFYLLEGEIYLTVPPMSPNSQTILQTHLANVVLSNGSFLIKATPKYCMVNVLDGSATVVEPGGKENVIVKGNLAVVVPIDTQLMVANKKIEQSELTNIEKVVSELKNGNKNVLFCIINKRVVGIRLK